MGWDRSARSLASLATLIRSHRRTAGLTQRQLADRAGIALGTLQDLEQGRTAAPRRGMLLTLAAALGLSEHQITAVVPARDRGQEDPLVLRRQHRAESYELRIGILGPLAVWRGARKLELGTVRLRTVLGLLVLHADAGARQSAIAGVLWPDSPPPTSDAMIQVQVSRIRRLLGLGQVPGDGGFLAWNGSGYRLGLDGAWIDVREFDELTAQAGQAAAAGDVAAACQCYERALRLWRGQTLEGLEDLLSHPAVIALNRRYAAVVLKYAATADRAGLAANAVEHVAALAAREPLDEQAQAQFMLALAATGRQAEALRVYQETMTRLDSDLGLRPGPELAAAHLAVLRGRWR
jgi:DNA-binding SARP family transcriptional activator/DNA-binding XRE family transcriptional regulator